MQSAFRPVSDINNYQLFIGYRKVVNGFSTSEDKSENVPVSPIRLQQRETHKRKWEMESKIQAVKMAQKIGVSKTITYLLETRYEEYYGLSSSTLQYWINQSKGRKRRYYE
ncbi:hypothetical protein EIN_096720 [Entamoeba invadens IP1]|uniref:Uncharacterized protein n=1 Tax=Entamoeba invadens IP1 TaxID=370355 RepID=A0A0A1U0J5_ENTIV|nr:hypothetical protein EIN_096720 [Entamoeba invadens IP1]ELP87405.1 hypothetical protein EIN_096720 [Entamoeba invadens IP1]|eukprot:XP_004254176.1 hypothetical protein EIN_096720 [Entamoeba invadens IP1]